MQRAETELRTSETEARSLRAKLVEVGSTNRRVRAHGGLEGHNESIRADAKPEEGIRADSSIGSGASAVRGTQSDSLGLLDHVAVDGAAAAAACANEADESAILLLV